jgi:YaiO family outer membrane protein
MKSGPIEASTESIAGGCAKAQRQEGSMKAISVSILALILVPLMAKPISAQEPEPEYTQPIRTGFLNEVRLDYEYEEFEQTLDPWHQYSLQYTRRTGKGSVIGRVNFAERFGRTGEQYEIDAYPRIRKGTYAYLNAGYSEATIFPEWRFGAQIYQSLPNKWEASVGVRRLLFENSNVTLYTGSIAKYRGNYYFALQPYFKETETGDLSTSAQLMVRRYYRSADDYLTFRAGYGESPEVDIFLDQRTTTTSWSAKIQGRKRLNRALLIDGSAGYRDQEIRPGLRRESFTLGASIIRRF